MSNPPPLPPDWNALANETLDLWQEYLASYTRDPAAKADMAKFMAPMGQMFAEWTNLMQSGVHGAKGSSQQQSSPTTSSAGGVSPSADGDDGVSELSSRVAELEKQLDELESRLSGEPSVPAETPSAARRKTENPGKRG